ncbi:YbaK/prolyl-tRNA synthetase associated domain-containing protein [Chromobacterium subtsugae]|uniref:YbaK/prolyl-tRNA synthetase associated domain-containing protein n=1 Tax=Chromobacterium subtsugae TaxID=251747 RepID=A0ABS7FI78_9NEIS|nr:MULTISPECIES: YbaK/prolyl-tRNA synthetase associated domain-containing protein [Chromobacterium]KUM02645.1 hypothetical protein Cv017_02750 [Chromobacterium subtsugae]KZE88031.1 hypothetical protein AWB61_09585 [Chromobacterium sp. F49]MBW7568754.1 YbaK/prolyl-tRNA synthetase associated domain-containing protein [Chromobacterium subtsugae]MBW8289769.1 YbaK/prolyl-tRNA synthetase associated domain-containing protein [Chromobacterium subtsugae]WSE90906.1 YbaK/prolyl-tRNA synthetase associated
MFERLRQLLTAGGARYRVIEHPAEGNSRKVADVRGTEAGQGAKAMLCKVADQTGQFVLAVLPGDERVDFAKVAAAIGARKVKLADAAEVEAATGCVIGSIPPFSFSPVIRLVVDPQLLARYSEIAFNAGRLDASIVLNGDDYRRLAQPLLADIRKESA